MKNTKWFAVIGLKHGVYGEPNDYKLEEDEDGHVHQSNCLFWVKVIDTGQTHTTSTPIEYKIYIYDFLKPRYRNFVPNINGWKLVSLKDYVNKNSFSPGFALIDDPWGKERQVEMRSRDEGMILEALHFLNEISKYDSWETYDIRMELKELSEEIEALKLKIKGKKT